MANTTTNGSGAKAQEADSELASVLKDLRGDLTALKADIDALRQDGAGLKRATVNTAKGTVQSVRDTAETAVADARDRTVHTVKTVEEDLADVVTDISRTVQRNPFTTIGVAVLGGMLLTNLFKKD